MADFKNNDVPIITCSAKIGKGIDDLHSLITEFNGYLRRKALIKSFMKLFGLFSTLSKITIAGTDNLRFRECVSF